MVRRSRERKWRFREKEGGKWGKSWGKGERGMEKVRRGDGLGRN